MAVKTHTLYSLPSVQTMIENRRRKFIGNLVNDEILTVVHSVMTFNMCFSCVLILVFFRPPPLHSNSNSIQLAWVRVGIGYEMVWVRVGMVRLG